MVNFKVIIIQKKKKKSKEKETKVGTCVLSF